MEVPVVVGHRKEQQRINLDFSQLSLDTSTFPSLVFLCPVARPKQPAP